MIRSTSALVLLVCGALALAACGNKGGEGSSTTAAAATSAAPVATEAATATATATAAPAPSAAPADSAAASASAAPADSAAPNAPAVAVRGVDDCCAALAGMIRTHRGKSKHKAHKAAEVCPRIADMVRSGRVQRADGLRQIRSALVGGSVPASCM